MPKRKSKKDFRSAMMAMAYRYKADLIINQIPIRACWGFVFGDKKDGFFVLWQLIFGV